MKPSSRLPKLKIFRSPPKTFFEEDEEIDGPPKGPLLPRPLFYAALAAFGVSLMLAADWFGLLLLNSQGVFLQIGSLNMLRVTAALMSGISVPSVFLMLHYGRVYSYTSEENVFFAITFSISFMLGLPCGLVGVFA